MSKVKASAQKCHRNLDAEGSKQLHQQRSVNVNTSAPENHGNSGELIKSVVLGGLDGIITTFAIVCAVMGSNELGSKVVILMGISNLIADAISMGLGDYLSEKAEMDYVAKEQKREAWEMKNYLQGEIDEMADIYVSKGFKKDDALDILNKMVQNEQFFLEHMMVQEIGVMPVDPEANPGKKGAVTFLSFIMFGSVPLIVYCSLYNTLSQGNTFAISCVSVGMTMFGLGCLKAKILECDTRETVKSGGMMVANGGLACSASYFLGWMLEKMLDVSVCG